MKIKFKFKNIMTHVYWKDNDFSKWSLAKNEIPFLKKNIENELNL